MTYNDLKDLLDAEATRINSPEFIGDDPVQFPRRFTDQRDVEIASLLCATVAWGNRKMICRDCDRMLDLMENRPFDYLMDEGYEDLPPEQNIHRTFFARDLQHFMRGLRRIYSRYNSLDEFCAASGAPAQELAAWHLVEAMNHELAEANGGVADSRCMPVNLNTSALKRVNMALRWLVRRDGIVDMGLWRSLTPAQLYIPMDVHVGNTARALGLLTRKSADRKAVIELNDRLRQMRPNDPVFYDYALFGIGIESKNYPKSDNSVRNS
ncbi:MAG: TIGR02757 family protein [Muribaculaceae bacterium]|nr:TIGR02757 family protein [Muribaculaceae bacterium]